MHSRTSTRILMALLLTAVVAGAVMIAGVAAWGVALSPFLAIAALAASGLVVEGAYWLRDEVRAIRWDAGGRLR